MTKMVPEVKVKWLAALRSGAYKQTIGRLYTRKEDPVSRTDAHNKRRDTVGGFCCIGVLICVQGGERKLRRVYSLNSRNTSIPSPEYTAGLDHADFKNLASMNDEGRSFAAIADYIEQHH